MKRVLRSVKASEGIILDDKDKQTVAAQLAVNNKAEWDAIEGYQKLIPFLEEQGDTEGVDKIKEIISDELNHSEVLRELMSKYDGDIPTNET